MSRRKQEESVYDWGQLGVGGAGAPKVKTYNVQAPAAGPKVKMHSDSSQVESVLNPVRGIRDAQARAGITPTDHSRHNILAIKEQSRLNALQKLQQQDDGQQPQVKPQLRRTTSGSGTGSGGSSRAVSRTTSVGAARQPSRGSDGSSGGGSRNFLAENRATAGAASRPIKGSSKSDDGAAFLQKSNYGQVPSYLLERRMQMAQEQEALQAAKVAAQIPPGLRQMPEAERLETLKLLQANRAEVEKQLSSLPIIIETPSMTRHKDDLERRLREIEEAQKIFSRPNVLVHANAQ